LLSHLGQAGKGSVQPFFDSSNIASSQYTQIKTEPLPPVPKKERQPERPIIDYYFKIVFFSKKKYAIDMERYGTIWNDMERYGT
jgi:hypothetical protein